MHAPTPDPIDILRRLDNLIRLGTVHSVDLADARCRVQIGALVTDWLPWLSHRAGTTRSWSAPTVGEQVVVLSPSGELAAALVLPAVYRTAHPAPSASADEHVTVYPDGAVIKYNHTSGALVASGIQSGTIEAAVSVTLDTPLTHCTGKLTVDGLLTYGNGLAGSGGGHGSIINGPVIQAGGDLSSNGIVLHTHTHGGVQSGGSTTSGPT